jgi:RNA 3'-terminal phosphate cyclase (ATP)
MSWNADWLAAEVIDNSRGPGNIVLIEVESEHVTEVFTGFGERGLRAEAVAEKAVQAARRYLSTEVAAGEYLADQLLLPLAMAGGGSFTTLPLSRHATTNIDMIRKFLDVEIAVETLSNKACAIEIRKHA